MRAKGRDWAGTGHRVPARGGRLELEPKTDSWDWMSTETDNQPQPKTIKTRLWFHSSAILL
eukprot:2902268-Prymnesium_polylepis.1